MIEWNLFYKMLGIPEEVTEPTFYDLLGLHPETCSAELVDRMLGIQKNRLRQNIPGPQFIPLILSFEQKKLERAAAVLRDPKAREKYHEYLRQKASHRKREDQKEGARLRLLRQARDVVNSLLNPDKTLDDSKRSTLAARLRELGIGQPRINSLLKRIPRPAGEAAKPGDEAMEYFVTAVDLAISGNLLTPDAERTIMALAKKLNIDDMQAVDKINQELRRRNAHRGRRDASMLERDFENRVHSMIPNGLATAEQYELLLALAKADNLPETPARAVLRRCLRVAVSPGSVHQGERPDSVNSIHREEPEGVAATAQPGETEKPAAIPRGARRRRNALLMALIIIAFGCFVSSVWFLGMNGIRYVRQLVSPTVETSLADLNSGYPQEQEKSDVSAEQGGTPPQEQGPVDSRAAPRAVQEGPGRTEEQQEHRITSSSGGSMPRSGQLLITAEHVRRVYSESARTEKLLADLATTMLACYCRATRFALGSTDGYDELRIQMREPSRSSYLTNGVTIVQLIPATDAAQGAPPAPTQSGSKTPKGRPRSQSEPDQLEQLRMEDTPEAADKLLMSLKRRSLRSAKRIELVSRILRALSTMTEPSIPQRLIEMLPRSSPEVAFQITRTLARASGTSVSHERLTSGLLKPANTSSERQVCAQWWNDNRPAWGQARSTRSVPPGGVPSVAGQTERGRRPTAFGPSTEGRAGIPQVTAQAPTFRAAGWEPDPVAIKLLAVTAHYAEITGDVLKEHKWGAGIPMRTQKPDASVVGVTCSTSDVGTDLLNSLDDISNELSRIITEHPDYEKATPMIDAIRLHEKDPRMAACQSQLQKVVVSLDATAELLIVLIRQADPNDQLKEVLARIEQERNRALTGAINVVHELRESCYYNLVLWDTLIEHGVSAAIPVPTDMPVRRVRR